MCANYIAVVATGEVLLVVASYSQLDFAGAAADSKPPFEHNDSSSIPCFLSVRKQIYFPISHPTFCILASLQHITKPTIVKPIYYYYDTTSWIPAHCFMLLLVVLPNTETLIIYSYFIKCKSWSKKCILLHAWTNILNHYSKSHSGTCNQHN